MNYTESTTSNLNMNYTVSTTLDVSMNNNENITLRELSARASMHFSDIYSTYTYPIIIVSLFVLAIVFSIVLSFVVRHYKRKDTKSTSENTFLNRPLPPLPAELSNNDDYEPPRAYFVNRNLEEIRMLPPPPPVFPSELATRQMDGEGAYLRFIPEDEPQRIPPKWCYLTPEQCEELENVDYLLPRQVVQKWNQPSSYVEETSSCASDNTYANFPALDPRREIRSKSCTRIVVSPEEISEEPVPRTSGDHRTNVSPREQSLIRISEKSEEISVLKDQPLYRSSVQIQLSSPSSRTEQSPALVVHVHMK